MRPHLLLIFLFIILHSLSCKKNKAPKEIIKIEGFVVTDGLGVTMGTIGNTSDDWQIRNWPELSAREQAFLNFPDNVDLVNTNLTPLYNPVAYPSPFSNASNIYFKSDDSVKIKIAVVDAYGTVFTTHAIKSKGSRVLAFDFSNTDQFPSGKSLRYYYSFSAAGQLNFKAGYGDVKVCRSAGSFMNCF